jgi:hypothetical protein
MQHEFDKLREERRIIKGNSVMIINQVVFPLCNNNVWRWSGFVGDALNSWFDFEMVTRGKAMEVEMDLMKRSYVNCLLASFWLSYSWIRSCWFS